MYSQPYSTLQWLCYCSSCVLLFSYFSAVVVALFFIIFLFSSCILYDFVLIVCSCPVPSSNLLRMRLYLCAVKQAIATFKSISIDLNCTPRLWSVNQYSGFLYAWEIDYLVVKLEVKPNRTQRWAQHRNNENEKNGKV